MTSRGEIEWNDEYTCSGDMTYIGAFPMSMGECIEEYCEEAIAKADRSENRKEYSTMCKELKSTWKGIENLARLKPEIIQRAISGQLDLYRTDLKKKCKEELVKKKQEEEDAVTQDTFNNFLEGDGTHNYPTEGDNAQVARIGKLRDCVGERCRLENRHKQFISSSVGNRAGPKKCPSCQQFKPALAKALRVEKYLMEQLTKPTDDIHSLLEGLSQLMEDSKRDKTPRGIYYDEISAIPAIRERLDIPQDKEMDGTCPPAAKAAVAMLATTFGIALEWQIKNGPFPGLSPDDALGLWNNGIENNDSRDTWEQICSIIKNMSITERLKKLEKKVVQATQDQKRVLQRAEMSRMLSDEPRSLATSIPRRKRNGWDDNTSKNANWIRSMLLLAL
jgi:hypothetical protein